MSSLQPAQALADRHEGPSTPAGEDGEAESYRSPLSSPSPVPEPMTGTTAADSESIGPQKAEVTPAPDAPGPSSSSIRSRGTRRSSDHEVDSGYPAFAEKAVREQEDQEGLIRRTPFFRSPIRGQKERWYHEVDTPSQWTSLFYDLVVVAVLTVFGLTHDLSRPGAIPLFLGYFTVIYWVWVSQVFYDIRYEADDGVHRFFKFIQVCLFLYIGAASGNWNPGNIQTVNSSGMLGPESAKTEDAEESFKTVVIAFMLSRAQLAVQYLICALAGRRAKRDVSCHWVSFITLLISCGLNIAAATITSSTKGLVALRLTFLYGSILMELLLTTTQVVRDSHVKGPTEKVGDRYGSFALIILGDGLLNIVRAFNRAIAGLSDRDTGTYAQAFMAVLIVYMLWSFLCSRFDKNARVSDRNVKIWELVNFPLSFGLLLLLGAIVNVVLVIANGTGTVLVLEGWTNAAARVKSDRSLNDLEMRDLGRYLYKLQLEPDWTEQLNELAQLYNQTNPALNPDIINIQYLGQIAIASFQLYGLEVEDATYDTFQDLAGINVTSTGNATLDNQLADQAFNYATKLINEPFTLALTGTLWLYPTAGIILILCAYRTILWNPAYSSIGHRIILYFQIAAGVCVSLLGLLDIGRKEVDIALYTNNGDGGAPMYILVLYEVPLVIVSGVYAIVFLGPVCVQEWLHRRRGGVYVEEEKGWIERVRSRIGRTSTQIETA